MPVVTILSGSNIGDRPAHLTCAMELCAQRVGMIISRSSVYETAPWGFESDQPFLNQVFCIESLLSTRDILYQLLEIEHEMGRDRSYATGYRSRTIDLDILFHEQVIIDEQGLTVPHPRIAERRFVLVPLAEILPGFIHPILGRTIVQLLHSCPDKGEVNMF